MQNNMNALEANQRAIDALPDIVAALENMMEHFKEYDNRRPQTVTPFDVARAALKKGGF